MKTGDKVKILPSITILELRLAGLVGQKGEIMEIHQDSYKIHGAWVKLEKPFLRETEWYIPYNSLGIWKE